MNWMRLAKRLLLVDGTISAPETRILKEEVVASGQPASKEVLGFLQEVRREGLLNSADFDAFFLEQLRGVVLADGAITDEEARWLRSVLYDDDGEITDLESAFLEQLKRDAIQYGDAFKALLDLAGSPAPNQP